MVSFWSDFILFPFVHFGESWSSRKVQSWERLLMSKVSTASAAVIFRVEWTVIPVIPSQWSGKLSWCTVSRSWQWDFIIWLHNANFVTSWFCECSDILSSLYADFRRKQRLAPQNIGSPYNQVWFSKRLFACLWNTFKRGLRQMLLMLSDLGGRKSLNLSWIFLSKAILLTY